jgi:hypothetical protein
MYNLAADIDIELQMLHCTPANCFTMGAVNTNPDIYIGKQCFCI